MSLLTDPVAEIERAYAGAKAWLISTFDAVKMLLTVSDPDTLFGKAVAAGAREVSPVQECHGWRVGRVADPFGHHWEIGCAVAP